MLRLVHPPPSGQGTDPPARRRRRSPALSLTPEEARTFRAGLRNVARAYGGFPCLAAAVGVPVGTLYKATNARRSPAPGLVLRVARAAGMHAEALIAPALSEAGRCSACGARAGAGAA
jgi:DNA-binding phage protein